LIAPDSPPLNLTPITQFLIFLAPIAWRSRKSPHSSHGGYIGVGIQIHFDVYSNGISDDDIHYMLFFHFCAHQGSHALLSLFRDNSEQLPGLELHPALTDFGCLGILVPRSIDDDGTLQRYTPRLPKDEVVRVLVARHSSNFTHLTSHVTRHTSHITHNTSYVTRHTSHVTRHTSHVTRHKSHVTRYTSHVTRHTSHVTRHTSHVTRQMAHPNYSSLANHANSAALPSRARHSTSCSWSSVDLCHRK
jgi:hypothetical protein